MLVDYPEQQIDLPTFKVVNDKILGYIRNGTVEYIRCSTEKLTEKGVLTTLHDEGKKEREFEVDTIILATGFKRPSIDFLPKELFPEAYSVSIHQLL